MLIPKEIIEIGNKLQSAGFQAYLVGGCVRDLLIGRAPKDWDIATNAKPEEIQNIFPDSVYENKFGTVIVKTDSETPELKTAEVTTFRIEAEYSDQRHPDKIEFAKTIEEDLGRRDFTVNAMAISLKSEINSKLEIKNSELIVDPFNGQDDLKNKLIRTVGGPNQRFKEDALRMMRAARFAVELSVGNANWRIEKETAQAIKKMAADISNISKERVRDELVKIIMTKNAAAGINLLEQLGLLQFIIPELREGINCGQNKHHIYTVWEHNLRALQYTAEKNYTLPVRLAALFHDIGKPRTKKGEGANSTFYHHEYVGAKMTKEIMERLRFPKDLTKKVTHLVKNHLFYYNVGEVTESGVRRFIRRVGLENIDDLIKVREADRIGSGVPKAIPYKLRHLLFMIEKVRHDPISPKMLAINGDEIMAATGLQPGPRVGWILNILLDKVLDDPAKNKKEELKGIAKELVRLSDEELKKMVESAKLKKEELESKAEEQMKKNYHV